MEEDRREVGLVDELEQLLLKKLEALLAFGAVLEVNLLHQAAKQVEIRIVPVERDELQRTRQKKEWDENGGMQARKDGAHTCSSSATLVR